MAKRRTPHVMKVQRDWDAKASNNSAHIAVPNTHDTLHISNIHTEGNVVKVWTNGNTEAEPDFVIVNPPTQVQVSKTETVEDPLGAIAQAIHGATR